MQIEIILSVDVSDLDIEHRFYEDSLTTEYWGSIGTTKWTEVEIEHVMYNDKEVELTDKGHDALVDYLIDNKDDYYEY